jgi:hypothetical protein
MNDVAHSHMVFGQDRNRTGQRQDDDRKNELHGVDPGVTFGLSVGAEANL